MKPGMKTGYQSEFPEKKKLPVSVLKQKFYEQNIQRQHLGYTTQYGDTHINQEGRPAQTTKQLPEGQYL